ncbi:MAG: thioredoxin family protein [Chloroflexi bacterium]|nr:thioredoxin family protein [Chloroflexota bacterium]
MDILTRAVIALLLILGSLSLVRFYQRWLRQRAFGLLTELGSLRPGAFVLVYFTTPNCVPCKTVQRPAINRLSQILGERLQVLEIDASQQSEVASRWGVLSVPTTFVIGTRGDVRHVNHGVTRAEQLLTQFHD